jgi:UDPglucose 6-dehydrogenase
LHRLLGPLEGRTVALWGLAFKAETDDMRESPALPLVDGVLAAGGKVQAHDPKAMGVARQLYGDRVNFATDPYEALEGAEALVIMTEWLLYRNPDFERVRSLLARPLVLDGRNLYDPERMARMGFEYHGIGRRKV